MAALERWRVAVALAAFLLLFGCSSEAGWREVSPLPEARWFHAAGVGSDGRIYAFGAYVIDPETGDRAYGREAFSAVAYDPAAKAWSRGPHAPSYRYRNRVVFFRKKTARGERFPVLRETSGSFGVPRELHGAAGPQGRLYWFVNRGLIFFDPAAGKWDQPAPLIRHQKENRWEGPMPAFVRLQPATATGPHGEIYLLGGLGRRLSEGWAPPFDLLASVDVYAPVTNTWRELAPMRQGRQLFAAASGPSGKLFAFGGYGHTGRVAPRPNESEESYAARLAEGERLSREALRSVEAYDPETDSWQPRAPMPVGLEGMGVALGGDGKIYLVGGTISYSNPVARREVYI